MAERAAAGLGAEDHAPGAAALAAAAAAAAAAAPQLPDLQQAWAPLLDHLQRQATAGAGSADLAAVPLPALPAGEPAAQPRAAADVAAAEAGAEPAPMHVEPAAAAVAAPQPGEAAEAAVPAAAVAVAPAAAAEGAAAPSEAPAGKPEAAAAAPEDEAAAAAVNSMAASLLPKEELSKLMTLLEPGGCWPVGAGLWALPDHHHTGPLPQLARLRTPAWGHGGRPAWAVPTRGQAPQLPTGHPSAFPFSRSAPLCSAGGLLFEFAGGTESAAELRALLRHPEQLVQHPGHMQQLIGMVDAAKKLLTAQPDGADAAAALASAVAPGPAPAPLALPSGLVPAAASGSNRPRS